MDRNKNANEFLNACGGGALKTNVYSYYHVLDTTVFQHGS